MVKPFDTIHMVKPRFSPGFPFVPCQFKRYRQREKTVILDTDKVK